MNKILIGHKEKASFPELHLENISVKIDTGAYTSSIHCHQLIEEDKLLKCRFLDPSYRGYTGEEIVFEVYTRKKVKSSNGLVEDRFKVQSKIVLFEKEYKIDLTLTNRKKMKYPVLIGRKFLNKRFLVDVSQKYTQKNLRQESI